LWLSPFIVQSNKPNPSFDPAKYRELYVDVDASRFEPPLADEAQWARIWAWRKTMNAVLARGEKAPR
jgi:hypothetical protein